MDIQLEEYERRHLSALRASSAECTLFLKRSGKLPLPGPGDIALYGSGGRHTVKGGTGSGEVNSRFFYNVEEALEAITAACFKAIPSAKPTHNAPLNVSPAAVVSTGSTLKASTR